LRQLHIEPGGARDPFERVELASRTWAAAVRVAVIVGTSVDSAPALATRILAPRER
jgi:hypothetical protein